MLGLSENNKLERLWKEVVIAYFEVIAGIFLEGPKK
jgi:hypothetical protein